MKGKWWGARSLKRAEKNRLKGWTGVDGLRRSIRNRKENSPETKGVQKKA